MKPLLQAGALLTLCSLLGACETTRIAVPVEIPEDRVDCRAAGDRPAIPPEHVIDWSRVTTVPQARAEHDAYVRSVRTREGVTVGWIVQIEGQLWACSNDDQWLREFYGRLPDPG
jgi:hypothetical protein